MNLLLLNNFVSTLLKNREEEDEAEKATVSSKQGKTKQNFFLSEIKMLQSLKAGFETMENLIPIMNKLQDVFSTIGQDHLDLPQIVVVGSQSAGKSSVLENIVRKDFLPRGKDIVTRRPLVLQLIQTITEKNEYAEFLHLPNKTFTDFQLVREEIEKETERIAGANKGISKDPIYLKIYSQKVLNLTLVDLPGITKIPIGDQPPDIEIRIHKLVLEYISKPNAIILAVSPANQDIVNSESIKLARQVDPEGKRTIGVLTKLDLMDSGTNAYDILTGKSIPLKLGFIGIINRSQQDIHENKTIDFALKKEEEFFKTHAAYRSISNKCGTVFLSKTLNSLLMQHIREKLPELKAKLNLLIVQTEQELSSYGDPIFSGRPHQGTLLLRLLTRFSSNFNASIEGTFSDISTTELSGGARLYYIFNSIFGQSLTAIDPCSVLSVQDIRTAIRNSTGPRPSLFIPEIAFDLLIKPQIKKLELPSLRCVELVFDELLKIVSACENKELLRFPKLHQKVVEVVVELLRERMSPTQAYIESLIAIQLAYINTNHPDFIGGSAAISMLEKKHERKRRDYERLKKQHVTQQLPTAPPTLPPGASKTSLISEQQPLDHQPQSFRHPHLQQHGKDGGFLTYFFGHQPNASPEPNGILPPPQQRSSSPARPLEEDFTRDQLVGTPDKEEIEVELIRSLIYSYFNITRKTIADLVPKTVMHLIVNYAKENIQNRLVSVLYKEDLFSELLQEDEYIMTERQKCKTLLDTYRQGATVLQDIF